MAPEPDSITDEIQDGYGFSPTPGGAESGAVFDPWLAEVVEAWPALPDRLKLEILAAVRREKG